MVSEHEHTTGPSHPRSGNGSEQLAEALATTLAKVQANLRTKILFEQTKKQAEELASQENVFRRNMQELEKAQRKSAAREAALQKEIESLRKGSS